MKIEKYLILNKYFLSLFGEKDFRDLQLKLKDTKEGTDSDGRTHFVNVLTGLDGLKINEDELLRYDKNIQEYEKKINYRRGNVSLKYFQYLAVLFTEIFLDNLKNNKQLFLYQLNEFLENYEDENAKDLIGNFTEDDFKKLAFWMATGSGKTLIAHINYYQFFKYNLFSPDNIIFITPNEGLSKQHYEELIKSGIPARIYSGSGSLNGGLKTENEVLVIEMTKFVEEKKGGGVTLPVETFEGKNLMFVDEGHKGRKSEEQKWAKLRDKLSENGFVFEYSATFAQILSKKNKETLKEYSKSIIFDYSYKYFYLDGYGKDFKVLNVNETKLSDKDFQETMFVANLLSFYEQIVLYEEKTTLAKEYNIEKPLWIFVGTTVTGKEEESDVLEIVKFIKKITEDQNWLKKKIDFVLSGKTGLEDDNGNDIFENRFPLLRGKVIDVDDIYKKVFIGKGSFKIYEIKNSEGEFGLKIGENPYFGVINIGDISGFKKLLEQEKITIEQDAISQSLFDDIKKENSSINILIGSKKFIEGWDTWRVSSMGLLNIGKGQGPQIIQLFGRGVRLKGKNMTLKRSENKEIALLETLNIYGIKADYMNKFLEEIRKEDVDFEEIKIPVIPLEKEKWSKLPYLKKKLCVKYEEKEVVFLKPDEHIQYTLDLTPKVTSYIGRERKYKDYEKEISIEVTKAIEETSEEVISNLIDLELLD
ncbi:MAG TPA: DEAD/DEAH box helicase family protein, partial [bacterium]|nr:DEAD/DEAH box helicase family protein [bacterium]